MRRARHRVPTTYDRYVGERIREARIALEMSQEHLAELMGVSYQQVQKYENGRSALKGARIERLVTALNRPLVYFFPNVTDVRNSPTNSAFFATKEGQKIVELWGGLSPAARVMVLKLAEHLARNHP